VKVRVLAAVLLALTLPLLTAVPASADAVTQLPGGGWSVLPTTTAGGEVAIVPGPDTPPAGIGSLRMRVATSTDLVLIGNNLGQLMERPWSGLSASYSTFIPAGSPPDFTPTMRFAGFASVVGGVPTGFTTLSFEPRLQTTTPVVSGEWQEWTLGPDSTVWGTLAASEECGQSNPCTFAEFQEFFPTGVWGQAQIGIGTGVTGATGFVDAVTVVDRDTELFTDFGPALAATPSATPSAPSATPSPSPGLPVTGSGDPRWLVLAGVLLVGFGLVFGLNRRSPRPSAPPRPGPRRPPRS
jgi:LPXTG-motif cell wall-anchored protein